MLMEPEKFESIKQYFDKPLFEASMALQMSETEIKTIIKDHGYHRWPYHGFRTLPTRNSKTASPFDVFKLETETEKKHKQTHQLVVQFEIIQKSKDKFGRKNDKIQLPSFQELMNSVVQNEDKDQQKVKDFKTQNYKEHQK